MSATLVTDSGHPDAQAHDNSLQCDLRGCTSPIGIQTGDDSLSGVFGPYVLVSMTGPDVSRFCIDDARWLVRAARSMTAVLA